MADSPDVQTESPAAVLHRLEQGAQRVETPCGDGAMVWHIWGDGPQMVLLHGGAGSWRHWAHNIDFLARQYRLVVADLPGLGESSLPPEDATARSVAEIVVQGIEQILGPDSSYDLVGFSFGGIIGAEVALIHEKHVRSLTIIGSGGLQLPGGGAQLVRVRHLTGAERYAAHATNLGRMMIADPARIDDLAVEIQDWNTQHSRLKTPEIARQGSLPAALGKLRVKLNAIYGDRDAVAAPYVAEREKLFRQLCPGVDFRFLPGAGHWLPYESPAEFHDMLMDMLRMP